MSDLHTAVRAWAKGMYPTEAGAELLCRTPWAQRLNEAGYVEWSEDDSMAYPKAGEFMRTAGYLSGGERRQIRLIASFLGQEQGLYPDEGEADTNRRTVLGEDLPGTDHSFIRLVQSAVGHAAGLHEHGGNPLPWPGEGEALTTCPVGIPHTIHPIAPGVWGTPPSLMAGPDGPVDPL